MYTEYDSWLMGMRCDTFGEFLDDVGIDWEMDEDGTYIILADEEV